MSLSQIKNAQVQSSLNVSGGGGGSGIVTGLVGNAGGSVPTTVAQPSVTGAGSVTVSSSASGLVITGVTDGVNGLLGTAGGSVATTVAQPTVAGAGVVAVSSTTAGLTITGTAVGSLLGTGGGSVATTAVQPSVAGSGTVSVVSTATGLTITGTAIGGKYTSGTATGSRANGPLNSGTVTVPLFNVPNALISGAYYNVKVSLGTPIFTVVSTLTPIDWLCTPFVGTSATETFPTSGSTTLFTIAGASAPAVKVPINGGVNQWFGTVNYPWDVMTERTLFQASSTTLFVNMYLTSLGGGNAFPDAINWSALSCPYQIVITQVIPV